MIGPSTKVNQISEVYPVASTYHFGILADSINICVKNR